MPTRITLAALAVSLLACSRAWAGDPDPATLYEISTQGSTERVKVGEKGKVVIEIRSKAGAHVSDEAPLKIQLTGREVALDKAKLTLADSVAPRKPGEKYVNPRFEVPFQAAAAGKAGVDAKLTFFICTDKICARQQKALSIPVEVQ